MDESGITCEYCLEDGKKIGEPIMIVEFEDPCYICNNCYYDCIYMLKKYELTYFTISIKNRRVFLL